MNSQLEQRITEVYGESRLSAQRHRVEEALRGFEAIYGQADKASPIIISAPGRTEISGNHTDHQHGSVLAASIDRDVLVVARAHQDAGDTAPSVRVTSKGYGEIVIPLGDNWDAPLTSEYGTTQGLIRGVLSEAEHRGYTIGSFDAYIVSDVLGGSGLSSSAAFETAIGETVNHLFNGGTIDAQEIAMIGCESERHFFGKPCGLMDQMACSVGGLCHMDFRNPDNPVIERLDFHPEDRGYVLCITDTKGSHADLTDDYAAILTEMRSVAQFFGKNYLREVSLPEILTNAASIRVQCGDRALIRAIHFEEEQRRVGEQAKALKSNDFHRFLALFRESGNSSARFLQNAYSEKDPQAQAIPAAIAVSEAVLGASGSMDSQGVARVHGGGFAGTVQAFVKADYVETYRSAMDAVFGEGSCAVYTIRQVGGVRLA